MTLEPKEFTIDIVGERTARTYMGKFRTKTLLTHRETIQVDNIRRSLLGADPSNSGATAGATAGVLAELSVRLIETPQWWKDSNGSMDLFDEIVLVTVMNKVQEIETEYLNSIKKQGDKAKEELKNIVNNNTVAVDLSPKG